MEEKILVIDDEMHIVELLKFNLEVNGYIVDYSLDSFEGYHKAKELKPNLILLDWMLPNISGIDVLKKIREDEDLKDTPVIMLTAKNMERDKVKGLEEGADDYITKPFNPIELQARVKSQLRRYMQLGGGKTQSDVYSVGGIVLNPITKEVTLDSDPIALTRIEYNILLFLMQHVGQSFTPREIYQNVWHDNAYGEESTVAVHIRHLREKIEYNPAEPRYLKAVWGRGYKLDNN